jgi:hypothetical protein
MKRWSSVVAAGVLAACVPADEAGSLGSVEFVVLATDSTRTGVERTDDGWSIAFDRVVLGFKTMTIGHIGVADACSYRGRGASSDVIFDPRQGLVQSFNGITPTSCPDVGIIVGPPDADTTLGGGVGSREVIELANDVPAHAIVEATATYTPPQPGFGRAQQLKIRLRFDSTRTSTRFGGCQSVTSTGTPTRGVAVLGSERQYVAVRFGAERLFRDGISDGALTRVAPYAYADRNGDQLVTMDELDATPFGYLGIEAPNGIKVTTFGDWVRVLFRYAFTFGDRGTCTGNAPGTEAGGQPAPGQ